MKPLMLDRFYKYLDAPLTMWIRVLLVLLLVPLAFSVLSPLWKISMTAPQYPKGLWLEIYSHKLEAGNNGQHLQEINTLNHYIGMHTIQREDLNELDWLPFAIGILALLTLRVAVVGNVRSLVDLSALALYLAAFSFARFYYKMWYFGHNLDPKAPMTIEPFTPAIFGTKQIANFTTTSLPGTGGWLLAVYTTGVIVVTLLYLWLGRRNAIRVLDTTTA
ncbi:MAG: hypothetical protein HUU55_05400 [Myxococcales bacterium]|nr:hypothetical protein [Myxococcales bacterium]